MSEVDFRLTREQALDALLSFNPDDDGDFGYRYSSGSNGYEALFGGLKHTFEQAVGNFVNLQHFGNVQLHAVSIRDVGGDEFWYDGYQGYEEEGFIIIQDEDGTFYKKEIIQDSYGRIYARPTPLVKATPTKKTIDVWG